MGHSDIDAEATYRAIGRFIFEFSQLEYSLRHYIGQIIGLDEKYFTAVMTHDFAMLCTAAKEILGRSFNHERKRVDLNEIIKGCHEVNQERVRVAHGLWVPLREGGSVHHVKRSSLKESRSIGQANHLEKQADRASELRALLDKLMWET